MFALETATQDLSQVFGIAGAFILIAYLEVRWRGPIVRGFQLLEAIAKKVGVTEADVAAARPDAEKDAAKDAAF